MRSASDRRVPIPVVDVKCNHGHGEFYRGVHSVAKVGNVNELLDGHVVLDLECLDRIYLNAYVPRLQVGGQVVTFFQSASQSAHRLASVDSADG
jgi:hypothetical protein